MSSVQWIKKICQMPEFKLASIESKILRLSSGEKPPRFSFSKLRTPEKKKCAPGQKSNGK
ncbi:hypothetical protein COV93_06875 [Candidatus Woesearchaeota archaeon CG11_big_fil_rev_8_21_14_0_20_43_8]|nr:MAG: hypothetical protein COV93_06875 [Candidatus Woesearchaeota archaeon CG11_big_fil_rev_8_21_14_0_20_43_8]